MSRASSPTSRWSSIGNGSGAAALRTSSSAATTSMSPVARLGFSLPGLRRGHLAGDLDAVLAAQLVGDLFVADDDLDHAAGLAQVEERDAPMITTLGHPPGERHGLADVLGAQGTGVMGADHCLLLVGWLPDLRSQVVLRWAPGVRIGGHLLPAADVLDLVLRRRGNQTNGMPRRSAYRICLPNFCADAATSQAMPRARRAVATAVAVGPRLLVDERDEHGARHGAAAGDHAVGQQRDERARDAERHAHAGVRRPAVGGEGVVAAAAADGLQPLVALHEDLHDGAGVVVEPARDAQVGLDGHPPPLARPRSPRPRRRAR